MGRDPQCNLCCEQQLRWQLGRQTPEHCSRLQGPELLQRLADPSLQILFRFAAFPNLKHKLHVDNIHQHTSNSLWPSFPERRVCFLLHAIRQCKGLTRLLRCLTSWVTKEGPPCLPPPRLAFLGTLGRGGKGRSVVSLDSSFALSSAWG